MRSSRIPAVQNSSCVSREVLVVCPIWYPTSSPRTQPRSCATLVAIATTARRLGWVQRILPPAHSSRICGSCVDLPQPVSPMMSVTRPIMHLCCSRCASCQMGSLSFSVALALEGARPIISSCLKSRMASVASSFRPIISSALNLRWWAFT